MRAAPGAVARLWWRLLALAFAGMAVTVAALWWRLPAELPAGLQAQAYPASHVARRGRRVVVVLAPAPAPLEVACARVRALCDELQQRPMPALRAWVADGGPLAGTWIVRAEEGQRLWVDDLEQQRAWHTLRGSYAALGGVMALTAVAVGWWPRRRR